MRVLIIADDLTGALDSTVAFTGAGLRCIVARRPADVGAALAEDPDVLGISTASREGGATDARAAVAAALDGVGDLPEIVFKKVDSRLKGHVAVETATVARRSGHRTALVAPAIPAQGRSVGSGRLTGAGVTAPIDIAAALEGSGLDLRIPDTRDAADFDRALAGALDGPAPLLVGAAGLAAALARRLAPGAGTIPAPRLAAPLLLAIGSRDPITLTQLDRLIATGLPVTEAPGGACPSPGDGPIRVVRLVAAPGQAFDPRVAGARFAADVARHVADGGVRSLFGCGGETADAILGALGGGVLHLQGEALSGVPVSRMVVGGRKLQLVTKSGGFGDATALLSIADAVTP